MAIANSMVAGVFVKSTQPICKSGSLFPCHSGCDVVSNRMRYLRTTYFAAPTTTYTTHLIEHYGSTTNPQPLVPTSGNHLFLVYVGNDPSLPMQVFVGGAPPKYVCTAPGWVGSTNAIQSYSRPDSSGDRHSQRSPVGTVLACVCPLVVVVWWATFVAAFWNTNGTRGGEREGEGAVRYS